MNNYFYLDDSSIYKNKYLIRLNHDLFLFPRGTSGSYGVFIARVLNLSYTDCLRYMRDKLGAELIGKNCRYITPYFDNTPEVKLFVELLNKRMKLIMLEHQHPYQLMEEGSGQIVKIPFMANEGND